MKRIANRELARIDQSNNVAGVSHLDRLALAAEEPVSPGGSDRLAETAVGHHHVLREPARTDADERHAIAMTRVHVRLNLEHESGEPLVGRLHDTRIARAFLWWRRDLDERLKERFEAEVGQRAAKEHRRLPPCAVLREIERRTRFADDLQ